VSQGYDPNGYHAQTRNANPGYDRPIFQNPHVEDYGNAPYEQPSLGNRRRESAIFMGGLVGLNHQGSKSRLREETRL
jgi:RalA-binding protein 1